MSFTNQGLIMIRDRIDTDPNNRGYLTDTIWKTDLEIKILINEKVIIPPKESVLSIRFWDIIQYFIQNNQFEAIKASVHPVVSGWVSAFADYGATYQTPINKNDLTPVIDIMVSETLISEIDKTNILVLSDIQPVSVSDLEDIFGLGIYAFETDIASARSV